MVGAKVSTKRDISEYHLYWNRARIDGFLELKSTIDLSKSPDLDAKRYSFMVPYLWDVGAYLASFVLVASISDPSSRLRTVWADASKGTAQ